MAITFSFKPIMFWGLEGHFPGWFPVNDFYLISAASLWWPSRSAFVRRSYPDPSKRMFLDCGGFSFFSKYAQYPFSPDAYLDLVQHVYWGYSPLLWASMDYPCEPNIERSFGLQSNFDRIMATLDHLEYLSARSTHPGLVPVIQGYSLDERLFCLEEIVKRGLNRRLMAIGSLCACKSVKEISSIVSSLSLAADNMGIDARWHLFGCKISYLSAGSVPRRVFSLDTSAWRIGDKGETKIPRGQAEKEKRFFRYYDRFRRLAATI